MMLDMINGKFTESDHPRAPDGKFTDGKVASAKHDTNDPKSPESRAHISDTSVKNPATDMSVDDAKRLLGTRYTDPDDLARFATTDLQARRTAAKKDPKGRGVPLRYQLAARTLILYAVDQEKKNSTDYDLEEEKTNARQMPQIYYARHMHPGVVRYQNEDILVKTDTIKRMARSMNGKPVYVHHQDVKVHDVEKADGYVADTFYNEMDGWCWSKFIVVTDAGHDAVRKGWGVSNAYRPLQSRQGGTFQNVDYNREILNGEYTHLAIVPDPRYEDSKIFTPEQFKAYQDEKKTQLLELQNSKTKTEKKPMFRLFKKEPVEIDNIEDMSMELQNGKVVTVKEMMAAVQLQEEHEQRNSKTEADKKAEELQNAEAILGAEISVNGTTMTVGELKQKFMRLCEKKDGDEKKNSTDGGADKDKPAEGSSDKQESDAGKGEGADGKTGEEAEKQNEKDKFEELQNAHLRAAPQAQVETSMDKVQRGQDRYGSSR